MFGLHSLPLILYVIFSHPATPPCMRTTSLRIYRFWHPMGHHSVPVSNTILFLFERCIMQSKCQAASRMPSQPASICNATHTRAIILASFCVGSALPRMKRNASGCLRRCIKSAKKLAMQYSGCSTVLGLLFNSAKVHQLLQLAGALHTTVPASQRRADMLAIAKNASEQSSQRSMQRSRQTAWRHAGFAGRSGV